MFFGGSLKCDNFGVYSMAGVYPRYRDTNEVMNEYCRRLKKGMMLYGESKSPFILNCIEECRKQTVHLLKVKSDIVNNKGKLVGDTTVDDLDDTSSECDGIDDTADINRNVESSDNNNIANKKVLF